MAFTSFKARAPLGTGQEKCVAVQNEAFSIFTFDFVLAGRAYSEALSAQHQGFPPGS